MIACDVSKSIMHNIKGKSHALHGDVIDEIFKNHAAILK